MPLRAKANVAPFGLWPSPIAPADVARGTRRFGTVQGDGDWIYWTEGRPQEKGRQVLLRRSVHGGPIEDLLPKYVAPSDAHSASGGSSRAPSDAHSASGASSSAPSDAHSASGVVWSARSRVHEYGGGEFLAAGGIVYFVNDLDQDIYELEPGRAPVRLTQASSMRFADMTLDRARKRLVAVAETQRKGAAQPDNLLVGIALEGARRGSVTPLVEGRDFYAAPRLSPDRARLAFIAWDLPGMPWDEAELWLAELDARGRPGPMRRIAGGAGVAASHPSFAPDGTLVFISDETGWGNLRAFRDDEVQPLTKLRKELGRPMWVFGSYPYAIDAGSRIMAAPIAIDRADAIGSHVLTVDTMRRTQEIYEIGENGLDSLSVCSEGLVAIGSASDAAPAIRFYTLGADYAERVVRTSSDVVFDDVSPPQEVSFRGSDGAKVRALYYAPKNGAVRPPRGAVPPALVLAHGGPTAMASRSLSPRVQFYTSRGFAVLDVDYAGSTGYGRAYRERLDGQWGIADVADCAAGARFLARDGLADARRIAIAGGSAGGYTVLMALATTDAFAAGSSHYGISDLSLLMEHTHKFEAGYLHRLLGTTPKVWKKTCRERSPIHLVDGITAPLILFQGLEDKVVPPEQSRLIAERLKAKGQVAELHEFAGEGHGFRRAETIVAVLEAELAFLIRAMGLG